ncbi:MAG: 2Fe-2S iron-sulfur cluster binding domain-containing protein [Planctomycetaceae bacterium]|nr:2Fe-2S iron-sulfur cluster binding domain-containing protein [Planctomycetaceae bacterium]
MTLRLLAVLMCALLFGGLWPLSVEGQVSPEEHAEHHPGQSQGGGTPAEQRSGSRGPGPGGMGGGMGGPPEGVGGGPPQGAGGMMGGGMGGMMNGMMERMGAPKPREMYPRLMDLPDLPLEERAEIEREAHQRMMDGVSLLASGLDELSSAAPTDDFAAMQTATASMREGLAQFESGLAAHRAIAEGKAPRNVALRWFKREMNLLSTNSMAQTGPRLWGMTPFHSTVMLVLILFAVAMIGMYFFKMRRAAALLEKLVMTEPISGGGPTTASPANSPPHASRTEPDPAPAASETGKRTQDALADCCDVPGETCPSEAEVEDGPVISTGLLPVRKKKLCRLRVARIDQETPDVKTFRLVSCHGGGIPFSYLPGQFLTLTLPVGDKPIRRSYTISSSPTQGYYCEISVKREEQGAGSRYLHDQLKVGDTIDVKAPSGKFNFSGEDAESIVLIGGGVGITPMMSITRALTDMAWKGEIYFIVACHDPEHFIFESELRRLEERHENLHIFAAMSRIDQDVDGYRKGRLSRELLTEWVPDITSKRIHICGPPAMMDATKKMLAELDVPAESIHSENFGGEQKPRVRAKQREKIAETDIADTGGTVSFSKSDKSTQFQPDETVLEASERVGVDIDYSCRIGTCGVCVVKLLSGEVSMDVEDGLEPEDKEAGMILACQAKSTGNVSVDA